EICTSPVVPVAWITSESTSTGDAEVAFQIFTTLPGAPRLPQVPVYTQLPVAAISDVKRSGTSTWPIMLSDTGSGGGGGLLSGPALSLHALRRQITASIPASRRFIPFLVR